MLFYSMGDHERTPQIRYDDISMKTKLILNRFGGFFGTLKIVEKSFLMHVYVLNPIRLKNLLVPSMLILQAFTLVI